MRSIPNITDSNNKKIHKSFFVLDVETWGLNPKKEFFAVGVLYGFNFTFVFHSVDEIIQELNKNKYRGKKIFAHNAQYDFTCIFGNIILNVDNSAIFNSSFISADYNGIKLCDSMNIFPSSVSKIGETLGYKKGRTPSKFKFAWSELGVNQNDIDYCIRDCKIIFDALLKIFYKVGGVRITIASLAMYNFRKNYLKSPIYYNELNDHFFNSYYGGRTEAFKLGKCEADCYDINSLYPYIMEKIYFPDFKNLKKYTNVSKEQLYVYLSRYEGYFEGRVKHKNTYFGFVPYRGKTNLLFPVGEFPCKLNFNELRYALENDTIEIVSIKNVFCAPPVKTIFKEYVNDIYNERKNDQNELNKFILKLLLNSLYGKFGMRKKYQTTYYNNIPVDEIELLQKNNNYYELKLFNKNRSDCYLVTQNEKFEKMYYSIASIASYITSGARIELLKGLLANENNEVVYCDTDSIFLNGSVEGIKLGNELGEWKREDKKILEIRGLKNYVYYDESSKTIKEAIKGVSKNAEKIGENKYRTLTYYKTKEAIRRQKPTGEQFYKEKTLTHEYNKRIIIDKFGNTKPIEL